jgi:hypothetical protein
MKEWLSFVWITSTLDTVWRVNNCETCCSGSLLRWEMRTGITRNRFA